MGFFVFDGKCSQDFGVNLSGSGTWKTPQRNVETAEVPGRNGALITYVGAWKNVTIEYPAWVARRFADKWDAFSEWWNAHTDKYYVLEDSYHPDYYRMARAVSPIEPNVGTLNGSGSFDLKLSCKPQKYLKDGLVKRSIDSSDYEHDRDRIVLRNPTDFDAYPLIVAHIVEQNSEIVVGDELDTSIAEITFKHQTSELEFDNCDIEYDSEIREASATIGEGSVLGANSAVVEDFPNPSIYKQLVIPARTSVTISAYDGTFDVYPRWYRI